MPDYKTMYFRLFNQISNAITTLQLAQREGENAYIENTGQSVFELHEQGEEMQDE